MVTPFQANVPVVIEGVGIYPGQYIFCDSSGAVVIPDSDIDEVLLTSTCSLGLGVFVLVRGLR